MVSTCTAPAPTRTGPWCSAGACFRACQASSDTVTETRSPTPSPTHCSGRPDSATSDEVFPDTDPALKDADSIELLRRVAAMVAGEGWSIGNADCSVVCEVPKLAPLRSQMELRLGDAVGAPVSVKGRRAEGLGAIGRGEGVVCFAVVVVTRSAS